jgi:hypothetical protein
MFLLFFIRQLKMVNIMARKAKFLPAGMRILILRVPQVWKVRPRLAHRFTGRMEKAAK